MNTKSCRDLLAEYQKQRSAYSFGELLNFDPKTHAAYFKDSKGRRKKLEITIYNPTKPIIRDQKKYLLGRVEPLLSEESKVMFFEESEGIWRIVDEAPVLGLQDPFHLENVKRYHIIGGVKISKEKHRSIYSTVFYRYRNSISELINSRGNLIKPFAEGPKGMKDIRFIELKNGRIAIFTRPQGGYAGLGKIGYVEADSLNEIGGMLSKGRIIPNQFTVDEWGGANELHLLKNGKIGVLGHIAHFDGDVRHYYAMSFVYSPETKRATHLEILTTADDFPPVEPKKPELGKIIFSGGLHREADGTALLYVGVGDRRAGCIQIKDPFVKHELS